MGGYPVTAVAAYRGSVFAGTDGGGLRLADLPVLSIPGVPAVVTALASSGRLLLCGTDRGLYVVDGTSGERFEVYGPVDEAPAPQATADGRRAVRCRDLFGGRLRTCRS